MSGGLLRCRLARTARRAVTGGGMRAGALLLLALAACANPVPPTGGPEDRTPPRVVAAVPAAGAVRVTDGTVVLTFSEPVEPTSVARALTVTPEPDAAPDVVVQGRTATVRLGRLRPNTTYVLTFGSELRDLRSVPLATPLTYAFSTGDRLDAGTLAGRVVEGPADTPRAGLAVLAFAAADSAAMGARALYRTQSGADGTFRFTYLGPDPLFVVALDDRNRNRRVDAGEAFAAPPRPALAPVQADSARPAAPAPDPLRSEADTLRGRPAPTRPPCCSGAWRSPTPRRRAPSASALMPASATRCATPRPSSPTPSPRPAGRSPTRPAPPCPCCGATASPASPGRCSSRRCRWTRGPMC